MNREEKKKEVTEILSLAQQLIHSGIDRGVTDSIESLDLVILAIQTMLVSKMNTENSISLDGKKRLDN